MFVFRACQSSASRWTVWLGDMRVYSLNYLIAIAIGMFTAYHMVISRIVDRDEVLSAMRTVDVRVYNKLKVHRSIIAVDVSRRASRHTDDFRSKSLGCRVAIVAFRSFRFAPVDRRLARRHRRLHGAHVGGASQQSRLSASHLSPLSAPHAAAGCRRAHAALLRRCAHRPFYLRVRYRSIVGRLHTQSGAC